jgi:N-acyl-D-aspartate/D-glutamate deacylase
MKEGIMAEFDTIIKDGTIVDGTRVPRYKADIGIKNGKIAKIGRLNTSDAKKVLDARGLIVAPGGIDLHTHYDAQIHWDPYLSISSWHGVTTITMGNCGFGFAPLHPQDAERAMLALSRNEAIPLEPMKVSMDFNWSTFPQYLDRLERLPLGINISHLFPISPAVAYAMGSFAEAKSRLPNEKETEQIAQLLREAMAAGAVGWAAQQLVPGGSSAVQCDYDGSPMISDMLPDSFYVKMAKTLGEKGTGCIQFTRSSVGIDDPRAGMHNDFDFNALLSEESGRPVLFNAIAVNDKLPYIYRAQLRWLAEANKQGKPVFGQAATARAANYITFEDWNLYDSNPNWREATTGTLEEKRVKLADPRIRAALREDYDSGATKSLDFLFGEPTAFIAYDVHRADLKKYEGLSVSQIAAQEHKHPVDAMLDLSVADGLKTIWQGPIINNDVEHYREIMSSPYTLPGVSDGGAHIKFITPGTYSTDMLTWMVRDSGVLSLEEAHYRLSYLTAWAGGITDRGCLRPGMAADIIVYDLDNLKILPPEVAHDLPANEWRRVQKAEGYRWFMINGEVTFEDGKCTGATAGRLLRGGQAA